MTTPGRRVWTLPEQPPVGTVVGPVEEQDWRRWERRLSAASAPEWQLIQTYDGARPDEGVRVHWSWLLGQGPLREYSEQAEQADDEPAAAHHGAPVFVLRSGLHGPGNPVTLSLHRDETWGGFELRLQRDGDDAWVTAVLEPVDALDLAAALIKPERSAVTS